MRDRKNCLPFSRPWITAIFTEFTGKYAYIETSEPQFTGDKAVLVSDMMAGKQCMRFKYHMHGEDVGSLSIYRRGFLVWKETGNHGNKWLEGQIDLDCKIPKYQVRPVINIFKFN